MTEEEPKTKEDIKNLMKHLEDEYRKANISEKTYKEMKEKYKSQLLYIQNTIAPEGTNAPTPIIQQEEKEGQKESKPGRFGKLFHKGGKKEAPDNTNAQEQPTIQQQETAMEVQQPEEQASTHDEEKIEMPSANSGISIEIEKLKAMLDAMREQKKATDDSLQSIFESIGELRSMTIQSDATSKEISSKMERIEDEISQVKPKEIDKKFKEIGETLERYQASLEKIQKKTDDMSENINKTYEILKSIGNIENLSKLNEDIQHKLEDIKEAMRYVERLSSKDEKIFIDLKKDLEDIIVYKAKQDALDDAIKDMTKNFDALNVKFEGYSTKKDLEQAREDIIFTKKELEIIKKTMGIVQSTLPESIVELRKQRDDIKLFLDSIDEQLKAGNLRLSDYEDIKKKNIEKLKTIEDSIQKEWKNIESIPKELTKENEEKEKPVEKNEGKGKEEAQVEEVKHEEEKPAETSVEEPSKQEEIKPEPQEVQPATIEEKEEVKPLPQTIDVTKENIEKEKPKTKEKKEKKEKIETSMPF